MAQTLALLQGARKARSTKYDRLRKDAAVMLVALQEQGFELVAVATSTLSAQRVIGNRLQTARLLAKLSPRELALRSGLHVATIHAVELDRRVPTDATRRELDGILREQSTAAGLDVAAHRSLARVLGAGDVLTVGSVRR
jgi:hypothetical protein